LGIFALFIETGFTVGAATYQAAIHLGYEPDELLGLSFYDVCALLMAAGLRPLRNRAKIESQELNCSKNVEAACAHVTAMIALLIDGCV
jgi:hypothetical protein